MSAFTNAHPLKHTHNKAQTNNLLHFDLYFGFHLTLPWPLNGNIEKHAHVYGQGCNPEASDLWPVRLFHRGNNDLTQEMSRVLMWPQKVVTVWDWAISATARGRFVPQITQNRHWAHIKNGNSILYSLQVRHGHFHFLSTHKRPAAYWSLSLNMPATVADCWDRSKAAL